MKSPLNGAKKGGFQESHLVEPKERSGKLFYLQSSNEGTGGC